jgi:uncharacterized phage protein gp47/JayE
MALTYSELTTPKSPAELREQLLQALSGVGFVRQVGTGTGKLLLSGAVQRSATAIVRVVLGGALGVATVQVSVDGGLTYSEALATGPSLVFPVANGSLDTGVVGRMAAGPDGTVSFVAGDTYSVDLATPTFPITAWQPGGVGLTLVELEASALADLAALVARIGQGGFVDSAEGPWLDLVAANLYNLKRAPGLTAKGMVLLTDSGGAGPFQLAPGSMVAATASGLRFTSTSGGVLPKGGSLFLVVEAEAPGSAWNVADGTITTLVTSFPGATVNNPGPQWIVVAGRDQESDTSLRLRCKARWGELGAGATASAYDSWAKQASTEVVQTRVTLSPTVPGQVDVLVAGLGGPVSAGALSAVQAFLAARVPLSVLVSVGNPLSKAFTIAATLYVRPEHLVGAAGRAQTEVEAYLRTVPIGGTVHVAALIEALMAPEGAVNVVMPSPAADVVCASNEVPAATFNLSVVSA